MSASRAWRSGWAAFWAVPERLLAPALAGSVAWIVAEVLAQSLISATLTRAEPCVRRVAGITDVTLCSAGGERLLGALAVGVGVFTILGQLYWALLVHLGLRALGRPVPVRPVATLVTALLAGCLLTVAIGYGTLPGVVAGLLLQYVMVALLAGDCSPARAVLASGRLVLSRPVATLGLTVLCLLTLGAGTAVLVVGIVPAAVMVVIAQVVLYGDAAGSAAP